MQCSAADLREAGAELLSQRDSRKEGIQVKGWRIETYDSHILGARDLLLLSTKLGNPYQSSFEIPFFVPGSLGSLKPCSCGSALVMGVRMHLPEGVFGHNWLQMTHEASGVTMRFDIAGALMRWVLLSVEHGSNGLKVTAAREGGWVSKWPSMFSTQDYDWTYTTDYQGHATMVTRTEAEHSPSSAAAPLVGGTQAAQGGLPCKKDAFGSSGSVATSATPQGADSSSKSSSTAPEKPPDELDMEWEDGAPGGIDTEMLMRQEPILFYKSLLLFEDFLHDNGISQLSLKIRVMPSCWFVLLRYWLRVDGVLMRMRDTRCFHAFGTKKIIREHSVKEVPLTRPAPPMVMPMTMAPPAGAAPPTTSRPPDGATAPPTPHSSLLIPVIKTPEEAAQMLQHQPALSQSHEVLCFAPSPSAVASDHQHTGERAAAAAAVAQVVSPLQSMEEGGEGGIQLGMEECIECMGVSSLGHGVLAVAVGSAEGEILAYRESTTESSHCQLLLSTVRMSDAHRAAEHPSYETATLSLSFVQPAQLTTPTQEAALVLASSGEDGTLKTWNLSCLRQGGATPAAPVPLCTVSLDGEGADYTRGGAGGARTACVQLIASAPGPAAGQEVHQQQFAAAVGRSVTLVTLAHGCTVLVSKSPPAYGAGALESSITALEYAVLPDGDSDGFSLLAACYGAVTIWNHAALGAATGHDGSAATRQLTYKGPLLGLCVAPSGGFVAAGCQDGTMHVWSILPAAENSQSAVAEAKYSTCGPSDFSCGGYAEKVSCHAWSSCGAFLASAGGEHVIVWDFQVNAVGAKDSATSEREQRAGRLAQAVDGASVSSCAEESPRLEPPLNRREAGAICVGQGSRVTALCFTPSGTPGSAMLAAAGHDGVVVVYRIGRDAGDLFRAGMPNLYLPYRRCVAGGGAYMHRIAGLTWIGTRLHVAIEDGSLAQFDVR